MNTSMITAMVSMQALQQKLDAIGDNMANVNTVGFKRRQATFEEILMNAKNQPRTFQREGRLSPLGYSYGYGMKVSQTEYDFGQGTLKETGLSTDLALEEAGLFEVDAGGVTAYTRDGGFQLSVNPADPGRVYLTTKEGYYVQGTAGPISIPVGYEMAVAQDGTVTARRPGSSEPAVNAGRIKLIRPVKPQFLQQIGNNMYIVPDGLDNTQGQITREAGGAADRGPNGEPLAAPIAVRQGWLEQSNVDLAEEMTELMAAQRAYQFNARAVTSSDTMMNLANNLRA